MSAARAYTGNEEVDGLLFYWGRVIQHAVDGWERGFALSIQRDRRKPNWKPSHKQLVQMQRLVERAKRDAPSMLDDLPDNLSLIEED